MLLTILARWSERGNSIMVFDIIYNINQSKFQKHFFELYPIFYKSTFTNKSYQRI